MTADLAGGLGAPELAESRILARAAGENFAVAPRLLPRRQREPLRALYGFARLVDEIGDAADGDRGALLDALEADLLRAFRGEARHPLLQRLSPVIAAHDLPHEPFARLIEANRQDQRLREIASWQELLAYCALSANPVGELVLQAERIVALARNDRLGLGREHVSQVVHLEPHGSRSHAVARHRLGPNSKQ